MMGSRHLRGWLSGIIGMWLATLLVQPAAALEFELPGERQLEIHGFYELRLRFFGEDLPANGATLSQFRHVLNVETELDMMPEGWGPFDTMIAFTRWIVSYETVYHKGIPPLAGANSYGGHYRTPSRNPKNYPTVVTDPIFVAGTWSSPYQPGTVVPSVQNLGRAYRTCVNDDGQFGNPAGLSFLCNFFSRSMLTGPFGVHDNPPAQNDVLNRNFVQPAGVVNPLFSASLLSLARGVLGGPDVVDLFARPRAGLRLETIFAGNKPGSTYCTGNANIDPEGCSTTFNRPQNQLLAGQGFGAARLLQAAAASGRAPFADGSTNTANEMGNWVGSGSQAEAQHAGRHAPWYPLLFDSHGNQFGRTWADDPGVPDLFLTSIQTLVPGTNVFIPKGTPTLSPTSSGPFGVVPNIPMDSLGEDVSAQDLVASGRALGQPVLRGGLPLYRLPGGGVTTDTTFDGQDLPQIFQEATLESEFGPAFSLFSSDPDAYEKIGAMLFARLDSDHFGNRGGEGNPSGHDGLAIINDTELTTSLWGASSFANQNPAVLTDMDAPLRPEGFLTQASAEWISANSAFLAHNLGTAVGIRQQPNGGPCGGGVPDCGVLGAEQIGDIENEQFGNKLIPGPIGPDGLEFTADDLPDFNFVAQTNFFQPNNPTQPSNCQIVQLNSNADNPATNDCATTGTRITGGCDILGNCTPLAAPEVVLTPFGPLGGGGGEVRAAWLGGAVIVNGQIEVPGQPVDLRGTRADCVPGSDDPADIAACNFGACNDPVFDVAQPDTCRFNPDRFVQALEAVQCARLDPSKPTGPGNFNCAQKREVITTDVEAIETWRALSQTEKEEQCQDLATNANKRFFFGGAGISGANPTGLNSEGICVELQFNRSLGIGAAFPGISSVQAAGLAGFFSNKAGRPLGAFELPTDLTQMAALLQQTTRPPGRPAYAYSTAQGVTGDSPNGLFFMTAGQDKFVKEHNQVYSNLDLDFRESELIWEHGASQDTKEFREGYIEFELLDSALFARVGKLLVVWGKTELVRNQDRLNPVDIGFGTFSALEESRIGQWATQVIYSPEWAMQLGPFEDLRFEAVMVWGAFEPQDLGKCGESLTFVQVCQKSFGALANGVLGLGLVGEARPSSDYDGWAQYDYGVRIEGRWDRFTFSISDFWGWDDTFYIEPIQTYARRADPSTGAPVNINGPRECTVRTKKCVEGMNCAPELIAAGTRVPVGPDNVANPCVFSNNTPLCPASSTPGLYNSDLPFEDQATPEDRVASIGNCLLFDNPTSADARQSLRNAAEISLNHYANLNLFHVICTLQFSPDAGFCGFDQLNTPQTWNFIAGALATG
ncbi:MAG: hypothetical protein VX614_01820, partial [Myxococcota bacterium]|nr:hypothetical protein [Myxococcota bacterium]